MEWKTLCYNSAKLLFSLVGCFCGKLSLGWLNRWGHTLLCLSGWQSFHSPSQVLCEVAHPNEYFQGFPRGNHKRSCLVSSLGRDAGHHLLQATCFNFTSKAAQSNARNLTPARRADLKYAPWIDQSWFSLYWLQSLREALSFADCAGLELSRWGLYGADAWAESEQVASGSNAAFHLGGQQACTHQLTPDSSLWGPEVMRERGQNLTKFYQLLSTGPQSAAQKTNTVCQLMPTP